MLNDMSQLVEEIAEEVVAAAKRYSTVFTSGGVGPTHDDVTYEAVAKSMGLKLELDEDLEELYSRYWPNRDVVKYLAVVPKPCELIYVNSKTTYCVVKVDNVYVLPGSPKYFVPAVDTIVSELKGSMPLHSDYIDVEYKEIAIVEILNNFVKRWENKVSVGSYPRSEPLSFTRITLEGCEEHVCMAKKELLQDFSDGIIDNAFTEKQKFTLAKAQEINESGKQEKHVREALKVLEECFDRYALNEIFLSFNGGKDCTVTLHLAATLIALRKIPSLLCFYVTSDPFPEVEEFVQQAVEYYNLEFIRSKGPMRATLQKLLKERETLKACLMGMRKGDPGTEKLDFFTPTDAGWPQMMRVNPILNWSYDQVWRFLLDHKIPYCSLYDKGYTSIGTRAMTVPNPLLKDPNKPSSYLPAYTLTDVCAERQGRE